MNIYKFFISFALILITNVSNAELISLYQYNDARNLGLDSSRNNNTLTISGSAGNVTGVYGNAFDLNGNAMLTGFVNRLPI